MFLSYRRKLIFLVPAVLFLGAGVALVSCTQKEQEWIAPKTPNSERFDLTNWKITLPIADDKGKAMEEKKLEGFASPYFYNGADGAMVFKAPVEGAKTKNTKYPRSELRERTNGSDAEWNLSEGGTMTATLKIDEAPTSKDGTPGRMVVGQIHGEDNELVRLYWDNGKVYFHNDRAGDDNKEHEFQFVDASGQMPHVAIGQIFSYKIDARGDALNVSVYVDGREYISTTTINPVWQSDKLYFKAGVYLGVNAKQGASGTGQVSFYALDLGHTPGVGLGGLKTFSPVAPQKNY